MSLKLLPGQNGVSMLYTKIKVSSTLQHHSNNILAYTKETSVELSWIGSSDIMSNLLVFSLLLSNWQLFLYWTLLIIYSSVLSSESNTTLNTAYGEVLLSSVQSIHQTLCFIELPGYSLYSNKHVISTSVSNKHGYNSSKPARYTTLLTDSTQHIQQYTTFYQYWAIHW